MGIERKNKKDKGAINFAFILLLFSLYPVALYAQYSVTLNKPTNTNQGSDYGMRKHPIHGTMKPHKGIDFPVPIGTVIPTSAPVTKCKVNPGGYGNYALVEHACGITELFGHLKECTTGVSQVISGNTGGSTGPHLHYEIWIEGVKVDPNEAFGKDLCDVETRKQLIKDAQEQLQGRAGGGGGAGSNTNTPAPTPDPGEQVTYVPPGEKDPETGVVNNGAAYYYVKSNDGRVYREVDSRRSEENFPTLPPTTTDVVPTGGEGGEVTGCATDTWKAMVNMAVLQTRRETMINQRYITKPDSVFAYSCFTDTITNFGRTPGMFSESTLWANKEVRIRDSKTTTVKKELGEWSLDGAITNAALAPYESYIFNFNHGFLGGTLDAPSTQEEHGDEEGHDHEGSGQSYAPCNTMNMVWEMAKCNNMTDEPMFPRFEDLITNDPRKFPDHMQCNNTGVTQGMIDIARGKALIREPYKTHLDILSPVDGNCGTPIRTGITVERQEGSNTPISKTITYPDGLCLIPGCSYQNEGNGEGSCVAK